MGFRPTEKLPCQLAEGVRNCPPLLADVGHHRGIVAHCCHSLVSDRVLEGLKRQKQSSSPRCLYGARSPGAPHPDRDASEYRRCSWRGGGVPRRPFPRGGGPPPSTKRCPCPLARTGVPEGVGDCSRWTSWTSDAIGVNVSGVLHGVLVSPAMTCVPTTPATAGPGGLGCDKNFLAKERNFWIRVSVGKLGLTLCMIMPRYSMDLDGERSDFSLFMTTRERQSARSWFTCCFILASEEDRISQSSRYRSRRTPRE